MIKMVRKSGTHAGRSPINHMIAMLIALMICLCAICAKVLLDARNSAWQRVYENTESLIAALEIETFRNIESFDLSLQAVADNLKIPELQQVSPNLRQLILFDRSATARHLEAVLVLDETGKVRFDSRTETPQPLDRSNRDYFQFHKNNTSDQLYIGSPFLTSSAGKHVVALSRRLEKPDGSFDGVVMGALRLEYFKQLFEGIGLGPDDHISLARTDGRLLMRWPYKDEFIGRDVKDAELFKHLKNADHGFFETNTFVDGSHRLIVYSQVGKLPLVIAVGRSTRMIYQAWWQQAFVIGIMIAGLVAIKATLMFYLALEFRKRNKAEQKLAVLATTDELTKLSNRRHFNETIDREWKRAQRSREPISLLMLDADAFKQYNDRHGHHAGDRLLQMISRAMMDSTKRATDFVARHGGDEFSILLPHTPADGAMRIAQRIHGNFAELCEKHQIKGASLSIGVATLIAQPSDHFVALLVAADGALYDAKNSGRNRIAAARDDRSQPDRIEAPSMRMA